MRAWPRAGTMFVLVACATLLAGCTSEDAPQTGPDDPLRIEHPDDYSYRDETNASRPHIHDYWDGQDERLIVAEDSSMYISASRSTHTNLIRPIDGLTFPQGTGKVDLNVKWDDGDLRLYGNVGLWVKTAADHEPFYLADVENGETVQMITNNSQNDLPHQVVSNWYFVLWFERPATGVPVAFDVDVRIEATAHRTLEIPTFPPHPDHWANETSLPLLEQDDETVALIQRAPGGRYCLVGGCFDTHTPDNGTIVPPETDHVEVVLIRDAAADLPLYLGFHGSGTTAFTVRAADETDGDTQRFVIPRDEARPDGPYNEQSQWEFQVYTSDDETYRPYTGGYRLQVTAQRNAD